MRSLASGGFLLLGTVALAGTTVDEDLLPGGTVTSTVFPATESESFRVSAPTGSVLSVDLRPMRKGSFVPTLAATLSDGSAGTIPPANRAGKTKVKLPFPSDGVLEFRVGSRGDGAGDYRLRTKLKAPRGWKETGAVFGDEPATLDFHAPPASTAKVKVAATKGSPVVPRILGLDGPDGPATPGTAKSGARADRLADVPLPVLGPWTISVGGADGTLGGFGASVRWKVAKGPNEDHRDLADLGALDGSYAALLTVPPVAIGSPPEVHTGDVAFDGKGGASTGLRTLALSEDPDGPLGVGIGYVPVAGKKGSYYTDGATAEISLDLGEGRNLAARFTVGSGGTVLHTGVGVPGAPAVGMLLRTVPVPARADLEGTWLYVDARAAGSGTSTLEIGKFAFSASGAVAGAGLRTDVSLVDGVPTPGSPAPVLRTGSLSVAGDGTVAIVTTPLPGAAESWTARTAFGADVLASIAPDGSAVRLLVRQGTGLSDADVAGSYLHFGASLGNGLVLRTGTLVFDGAGRFAGDETITDIAAGGTGTPVPVTGDYSVDGAGAATFAVDGGSPGSGVVGPGARFLLTVGAGEDGVSLDLLLATD